MSNNLKHFSGKHLLFSTVLVSAFTVGFPLVSRAGVDAVNAVQQSDVVKGHVLDPKGEPVIGATVKVKGAKSGVITDVDGNFVLTGVSGGELEISYIGYVTQFVSSKKGAPLNVVLKEDSKVLDEVVVVGFGTQKKLDLTGAVSVVTGDEIAARPVQNATQALQGLIPGLQISSNSGTLDATPNINVRGTGTIGEGSSGSPLILIDGMEGDLNTVNPQDIESISVLKDAAASSIYGSRAPFGVILVTTKKVVLAK